MTEHDDLRSLLGAYATGALSLLEQRRVARHLESCPDCAREARLLTETASELSCLAGEEPLSDELVDRIVAAMPDVPRAKHRRPRLLAALAAAVVLAVGALGVGYARLTAHNAELSAILAGARAVPLLASTGFPARGAIYLAQGRAAVVLDDVPAPGRARSYQLWTIRAGTPSSLAVFESSGRVVKIVDVSRPGDIYAVTIEPEGGSVRPTTDPVLLSA